MLTLRTYWSGRRVKSLPEMVKVIAGMVCSRLQSTTAGPGAKGAGGSTCLQRQGRVSAVSFELAG